MKPCSCVSKLDPPHRRHLSFFPICLSPPQSNSGLPPSIVKTQISDQPPDHAKDPNTGQVIQQAIQQATQQATPNFMTEKAPDLSAIDCWIFDVDNTLYAAECQLFAQIDARMTAYIQQNFARSYEDARKLQKDYYVQYGTTMCGLMKEHDVCPDEFMSYVHDIDYAPVKKNPALAKAISALPGKRHVFTNGSCQHAKNVTDALGITDLFDGMFDVKDAGYTPKPHQIGYDRLVERHNINPERAIMFEDISQNLLAPKALGMTTVLICSDAAWLKDEPAAKRPAAINVGGANEPHIDYATNDLTNFLETSIS